MWISFSSKSFLPSAILIAPQSSWFITMSLLILWSSIEASIELHKISKLIVINHEDCGAIKIAEGKKDLDENEIHKTSYQKLKQLLNKKFPKLRLEFHIMKLNQKIIKL